MSLQFEITDSLGNALQDISLFTSGKAVTRRLNLPWTAKGRCPAHMVGTDPGDGFPLLKRGIRRLKVRLDGSIIFNGFIWNLQDDGDENTAYTEFTAIDPMVMWAMRPARDADGDFSKPSFIKDNVTGTEIMAAILDHSETYEGPLFLNLGGGTTETGGADVTGAPTDWPMTIQDIATLMTGTGETDIVLAPQDTTDGNMATPSLYNGAYGSDLTGSVNFDYATGDNNVRSIRRMEDMQTVCNKLWYYLGPRVKTPRDPAGDQHWRGNVTGDGYPDGAGGSTPLPDPPGGDVDFSNPLGDLITASRTNFGVFMDIRIYDDDTAAAAAPLYAKLWQTEQTLRVNGRELVNVTPIRGIAPTFDIGDRITLNAGTVLRGGFSGYESRVYSLTIGEDDDGVPELTEITTSPDGDAA